MAQRAFTLVELMIVVAIVGLLAAIAIPTFATMQARARFAEAPLNYEGIRTASAALAQEYGWTGTSQWAGSAAPRPFADIDKAAVDWNNPPTGPPQAGRPTARSAAPTATR